MADGMDDLIMVVLSFGGIGGAIFIVVDYLMPHSGYQLIGFIIACFIISYSSKRSTGEDMEMQIGASIIISLLMGMVSSTIAVSWRAYMQWNIMGNVNLVSLLISFGAAIFVGTFLSGMGGAIGDY